MKEKIIAALNEKKTFLKGQPEIRHAVYNGLMCFVFLLVQVIIMDKNPVGIIFDIIIPFLGICFFCLYAINNTLERPFLLVCPPITYFISLVISCLINLEIGSQDKYPFVVFFELIPVIVYFAAVATGKIKKAAEYVLKFGALLVALTALTVSSLAVFFDIKLYESPHTVKQAISLICGYCSVISLYWGMSELVRVSGVGKTKLIRFGKQNKEQDNDKWENS